MPRVRVSTPLTSGRAAVEALDLIGALLEQHRERRADGAVAEQADLERLRVRRAAQQPSHTLAASGDIARGQVLEALAPTTTRASPSRQKITGGRGTPL